jgi:hypothetical protein
MLTNLRDKLKPIGRLDVLNDVVKRAKEYLDGLPKELLTTSRLLQESLILNNLGDVLSAQGKLQESLDDDQQFFAIAKRLTERDKSNSDWQRDLIVALVRVGKITGKIGGNDNVMQAQQFLQAALNSAEQYPGPDRQNLMDVAKLALQNLVHSD